MKLIVTDVETSDLDPNLGAQILELAWLELVQNEHGWNRIFSTDAYFEYYGPIAPGAHAVHHIPPCKLTKEKGAISREKGINFFIEHIENDSLMVAHNAAFDAKFLPEITRPWICTMRCAKHAWPNAPGYSNQVLRYWKDINPFDIDPIVRHNHPHQARYDVATTAGILIKLLEQYSVEQLLSMSNTPVRLQKIRFGKHKGMSFEEIPRDYLSWLRKRPDLDVDVIYTIDSILR